MDIDFGVILKIVFGVLLSLCVLAAALFVADALTSDGGFTFGLDHGRDSTARRIGAYFRFVGLLVGIASVIGSGVWGVLAWMPDSWHEARFGIAGLAAMSALPITLALQELPRMRRTLAVNSAAIDWLLQQFRYGQTPTVDQIEKIAADTELRHNTVKERAIALAKLDFARALKSRDEKFESQILQRWERKRVEDEAEEARRTADKVRFERLCAVLAKNVRPLRQIEAFLELREDEEVSLGIKQTISLWQLFKELVVSARPASIQDLPHARQQLAANIGKLAGVTLRDGAHLDIVFHGNERDGHCDAISVENGEELSLFSALQFEESVEGLLHAFFFGVALQRKWSWGHGLYGRDYTLLATGEELRARFIGDYLSLPVESEGEWPPPGIRLRRLDASSHEIACLVASPNGDIYDMTVKVVRGSAGALHSRTVHTSGRWVLY